MSPVRFEPTISAGERPQTYASDRAATWTGATLLQTQNKILEKEFRNVIKLIAVQHPQVPQFTSLLNPIHNLEFQARNEIQKQVIWTRIGHSNFLQDLP